MAAHCEIAAGFAARLGFGPHVQDAVHDQYERYDGRGPAFHRRADAIPRAALVLQVAPAADFAGGVAGPGQAAAMVRQRAGSYFAPDVAEAYSTWPAACGHQMTVRFPWRMCFAVTRGPLPMRWRVTGGWRCARR